MSDKNLAIQVDDVSKHFILPHNQANSIKSLFTGLKKGNSHRRSDVQRALRNVSFDVKQGEFFGVLGRNGSGKSTLLKILAGIYQPTDGRIQTYGKLVPFIELGVGFNPELTGRENVYLNGAMLGFSKKEVEAMYEDIVSFAELKRFMDQKLKNYSSGMQVRLAFSMAVRADADILLIDEVLAVGDADFQRKCFDYFKSLKRNKTTVVFVSHDMEAVREYCDRALLIEDSKIVTIGSASAVAREYTKLFTVKEDESGKDKTSKNNRWGDEAVTTTSIKAEISDESIIIHHTIKANKAIESPVAGFRIRDGAGREITGTNTKIEQTSVPNLNAGQTVRISWQIPNILSDGRYSVDPAILHADGITVAEWWDDALMLKIKKHRHLPYSIDPPFGLDIELTR